MIGLDYRDARPLYEQIKDNFKKLILSGGMVPEEKMPSVRELASELSINPNTIQRAYRELELEGYIYTVTGRGSFVVSIGEAQKAVTEQLLRDFDKLADDLIALGVTRDALIARLSNKGGTNID